MALENKPKLIIKSAEEMTSEEIKSHKGDTIVLQLDSLSHARKGISTFFAQSSIEQQFDFANQLIIQERYFDAITELKRLQFFDVENKFSFQSNYLIGKSYKAGAKFDEAVNYFTRAEMNSENDDDYFTSKIFNARTNILRRTTKQAEKILNELLNDPRFISKEKEINYWIGWNYIFSDEWEKAFEVFNEKRMEIFYFPSFSSASLPSSFPKVFSKPVINS